MEEVVLKIKAEGGQDTEAKVKSIKQQLKEAKEAALQAKEGTEEYFAALNKAAGLADKLKDVNEAVNTLDPGAKAAAFGNLINTVAGGFQTITGLYGLLGAKSEDVEKLLLKVQAASAMAMGIQSLVEAQKQWANLSKVVSDFFANTSKAALTGYAAIILVASAVVLLAKEYLTATDNAIDFQDQLKSANKDAAEQISRVKLLTEIAKDNTQSLTDRKDAIKELNKISPEYLGNLTLENIGTEAAEKATKAYTQALLDNAKAQAASAKIVELQGKVLDGQAAIAAANAKIAGMANKSGIAYAGLTNFIKEVTADIKLYEDQMGTLTKIVIANDKAVETTIDKDIPEATRKKIEPLIDLGYDLIGIADELNRLGLTPKDQTIKAIDDTDNLLMVYDDYWNKLIAGEDNARKEISQIGQKQTSEQIAQAEALRNAKLSIAQNTVNGLSALGELLSGNGKKNTAFQKTLAIAQIAIDTAKSIAATISGATQAAAAGGPAAPFLQVAYITSGIASVLAAMASAKRALQQPEINQVGGGGGSLSLPTAGGITPPSIQPPTNTSGLIQEGTDFKVYVVESDITNTQQGVQQNKKKALITI
jgi:hypothetical protein